MSAPDGGLLTLPVEAAARAHGLRLLQRAHAASDRLADPDDAEALHDFRVAVRRLHTFLRAYRAYLPVSKKLQRRLRAVLQRTNPARDAEVGADWLAAQRGSLSPREEAGLEWLLRRLAAETAAAGEGIAPDVRARWRTVERKLNRCLERPADEHPAGPAFAAATAGLLREQAAELAAHLDTVRAPEDTAEAHAARLAVKRVRYLLEPLRRACPSAKPLVKELATFQDCLGTYNDARVLLATLHGAAQAAAAERAERLFALAVDGGGEAATLQAQERFVELPGLLRLGRLAAARHAALFDELRARYLSGGTAALLARVEAVADELDAVAPTPVRAEVDP